MLSLHYTAPMSPPQASGPSFPASSDEPFGRAMGGFNDRLLYNTVYCSRATAAVNDETVQRIIQTTRRWNPENGITGLLVFGSGIFFSVARKPARYRHQPDGAATGRPAT